MSRQVRHARLYPTFSVLFSYVKRVPNRFKCTITPRTDPKVDLARQAAQA